MAAAPATRGGAVNISSAGTGGAHAHLPGSNAGTARGRDERLIPPLPGAQRARPLALSLVLSLMLLLALLLALALEPLPALPRANTPPYAPHAPRAHAWRRR